MRKIVVIKFLSLCFFLILLTACGHSAEPSSAQEKSTGQDVKDELTLAIGGEPDEGFDPTTGWGRYGSPLFQSTLLTFDQDFEIRNDLAVRYEVSEDGLEWKVNIRNDVKFSDGEPLTAKDVVFTFNTAKSSASIIDLTNLEKVEALDDQSIRFTLKHPQSTFIYLLASMGIVPEHAYTDSYNENPIGSGPFELVQWNKGEQLIVQANPYYYGKQPFFKKLNFVFLSEDAAFAAAKAGEVDVAAVTSVFAKEDITGMHLVELESADNRGIMLPYVHERKLEDGTLIGNNVTADQAIRKALNIAVDRQELVDGILEGYGTPAYSVADQLPWWNPDTVFEDGRMDAAKEMLEKAGWKIGKEGIREKNGLKAELTLLYPAGDQMRQSLSLAFADMVRPLGISIKTEDKSWNDLERLMHANPVMMGWGSHDPLEMYYIYSGDTRGEGFYNANYYKNPVVDEYLNKAIKANDQDEAKAFWQKAQWDGKTGFSVEGDAPWVWLVNLKHLYFVRNGLEIGEQKIQPHGHGWPVTDFIEEWYWKDEEDV
ncbi:ABC transporter substrate-binding protein [Lederbergia ruris]|uniref:ABC transporter substrate-binding protein n=1 Tax=Lederbergia ruris TaxID=217495 RepID=A0ABQ4KNG0_9BACI|nr:MULTISPECIES: ABC transporter substrate-binding protein [Lederbergia]MBP1916425.1 peptide/nickel transport system substrate-binding protein [Lederbergia galactosidilytica]GIN59470.1 ABC transporter substrate-binding protein [Lederbergia ruris]